MFYLRSGRSLTLPVIARQIGLYATQNSVRTLMKHAAPLVLATLALVIAGCDGTAPPGPTAPFRSPAPKSSVIFSACSQEGHDQSTLERSALFSGSFLTAAEILWTPVVNNCLTNLPLAQEAMLTYIRYTIAQFNAGNVNPPTAGVPAGTNFSSASAAMVNHWNTMFAYVGYAEPSLPPIVLESGGTAKVITQSTPAADRELKIPAAAAMTVPVQTAGSGDVRGHLFTIYPLGPGCLTGSNLVQTGPCFQFSANPTVSPKFDPKVQEGICEPVNGENPITGVAPALGHLDESVTKVAGPVGAPYPSDCIDGPAVAVGSWTGGLGDIAKRLAWHATQVLAVKLLYAAHGGLGGVSEELSPFSALETTVFKATFTSAAGAGPGAPEVGLTWTQIKGPQSTILVQSSLGDLVNSPVVLNQGGGNCVTCGGLELRGTLKGAGASLPTTGRYLVTWRSLQNKPTTKDAPFVLRASNGAEIARVSYASKSSKEQLLYNGVVVGSWTKGKQQKFEIIVDLNNHITSLGIDGVLVAQNKSFNAPNLATIAAEFSGIDAGIIGWDDISIVALPDP